MAEWYIRTYLCDNGVEDKTKFPVPEGEIPRKNGNRKRESTLRRAEKGATEARTEVARLLNCNFLAKRDYCMTLEYGRKAYSSLLAKAGRNRDNLWLQADHQAELFIRRVQRECRKRGIEFRYLYVTSDRDGKDSARAVRVHHHIVVNAEAIEICRKKWTAGDAWANVLYGGRGGDLGDLAAYLIGQVRHFPGKSRYSPSRNLKKARPMDAVRARNPEADLTVPKGCVKIWAAEHRAGRPQHIRYWRPPGVAREGEDDG